MSEPLYLLKENRSTNEPRVPKLIKNSFISVPSAGMRSAPEILVLELMKEVFHGKLYDETKVEKQLNPERHDPDGKPCFSERERAILYALRGRRKKTKKHAEEIFFAPAYPQLAEHGWFRKSSERVIKQFFFSGPIVQSLYFNQKEPLDFEIRKKVLFEKIQMALIGNNSPYDGVLDKKDILAATLQPQTFINIYDNLSQTKTHLDELIKSERDSLIRINNDEISDCITQDFIAICDIEGKIPRMQWLQLLMTFLRFALPMWLLSQMQITKLVYDWLIEAVDGHGDLPNIETISDLLSKRNCNLLHPTLTPTREIIEHIDSYMKCRVQLNILLYCLLEIGNGKLDRKNDNLRINFDGGGPNRISIEELLDAARKSSGQIREMPYFKQVADNSVDFDVHSFLIREGGKFSAWKKPRNSGQGKNIDEFFRVLYQSEIGDESGGYLITPIGQGSKRGFMVFPGQMLLKTMAYLAAKDKTSNNGNVRGMLVLQDVEDHFAKYGVDFSTAADARPKLMKKLQSMGLLRGSPDAGSSVAVEIPY